jgi:hypothetical protein
LSFRKQGDQSDGAEKAKSDERSTKAKASKAGRDGSGKQSRAGAKPGKGAPVGKKTPGKRRAAKRAARGNKPKKRRAGGLARLDDGLVFVLSYPLRVRILASLKVEGDGSAADLGRRLNCSTYNANYHLKVLRKYGCAEIIKVEQVRGVDKKIYRAKVGVEFPTEILEVLPPAVHGLVVTAVLMTSFNDAEVALVTQAYEDRPESHASWSNLRLDERGWNELLKVVDGALVAGKKIEKAAKLRLEKEDEGGLTVSLNMSSFVLPDDAPPLEERLRVDAVRRRVKGKSRLQHAPDQD